MADKKRRHELGLTQRMNSCISAPQDEILQVWDYSRQLLSGSVGEKFPGQTGSLEFFTALPDKIFCLGLSSHSWPSGKFVYARYARYTNSNALLWLRLSSIDVFCPHFVRAKNRPFGLERLSSPRQILFFLFSAFSFSPIINTQEL